MSISKQSKPKLWVTSWLYLLTKYTTHLRPVTLPRQLQVQAHTQGSWWKYSLLKFEHCAPFNRSTTPSKSKLAPSFFSRPTEQTSPSLFQRDNFGSSLFNDPYMSSFPSHGSSRTYDVTTNNDTKFVASVPLGREFIGHPEAVDISVNGQTVKLKVFLIKPVKVHLRRRGRRVQRIPNAII